jgi:hypothetical protein
MGNIGTRIHDGLAVGVPEGIVERAIEMIAAHARVSRSA